jgi:hypothetical protein
MVTTIIETRRLRLRISRKDWENIKHYTEKIHEKLAEKQRSKYAELAEFFRQKWLKEHADSRGRR